MLKDPIQLFYFYCGESGLDPEKSCYITGTGNPHFCHIRYTSDNIWVLKPSSTLDEYQCLLAMDRRDNQASEQPLPSFLLSLF